MFKNKDFEIIGFLTVIFAIILVSCTKQDRFYKDLIVDRPVIGKVDSVWAVPGNQRMRMYYVPPQDISVKSMIVYWNGGSDSLSFPIIPGGDTTSVLVEGISEGVQEFTAITEDENGDRSLPVAFSLEIFGPTFQRGLRTPIIDYAIPFQDSVMIFWKPSFPDNSIDNLLQYFAEDGSEQSITIANGTEVSVIQDIDLTKEVTVESMFLPQPNVLDTFIAVSDKLDLLKMGPPNTMTFDIPSDATVNLIDFNLVRFYTYTPGAVAAIPEALQKTFDMGHLRGGGSKHNIVTMNSTRPSAFSAVLNAGLAGFTTRNKGLFINMGISETASDFYDNLDETNRTSMIADFASAKALYPSAEAYWPINTGQIILLESLDRGIYVAIKAANSNPNGAITIEFKVSRP